MRSTLRIFLFLLTFFAAFRSGLKAQSSSCISADAGLDDTICSGHCATLFANVSGTRQTNIYSTSVISYTPYSFTGGNPVLVNLDDLWSPLINIPFCFEFYGNTYNQLVIGTNGVITFDVSQANGICPWTINVSAPNPGLPMNSIMAPFHDIDPTIVTVSGATSINWNIYGTAPCRTMVINWNDIGMYGNNCNTLTSTSQVVLHESTNIIDIFIQNKSSCLSWNSGAAIEALHNSTGTSATIAIGRNYPTVWNAINDGIEFKPAGAPNFSIQWIDPSNTVVSTLQTPQVCPTVTTNYTLQVINTSCTGNPVMLSDSVTIFVTQSNITATDSVIYPSCPNTCNGSITIFASSGVPPYSYSWSPNVGSGPAVSGLCQGSYACTVTDATGCTAVVSVSLIPPPPFTLSTATTPSICNDSTGTALVNITGGTAPFSIYWSNGDTTSGINGLMAGTYYVIVTDSANCPDTLTANVPSTGLVLNQSSTALLCNGDCNATASVTVLSGVAPYTYSWAPYGGTGSSANALCSGPYFCTVVDSTGCTSIATVTIASPPPVVATPSANQTICLGQSTIVSVGATGGTAPYTYSWNNGLAPVSSNNITPTQTTVYSIVVTDANGCVSAQQSTLVKVVNAPIAGFSSIEATCPPTAVGFTNLTDSAVVYYWDFGDPASGAYDTSTQISPTHIYNNGGNYTVTLIAVSAYGCADTITILNAVQVPLAATASASMNTSFLTSVDPVALLNNSSTNAVSYLIFFGDGDSLITTSQGPYSHVYDTLGTFTITLIAWSPVGCPDTTWLTISIEDPTTLYIPNAFTPNGDGKNDFFMPTGTNIRKMELLIFDRWGQLLFQSEDVSNGWDGTFKGVRVQEDVYVWKLTYTDNFNESHDKIGHVSVIR